MASRRLHEVQEARGLRGRYGERWKRAGHRAGAIATPTKSEDRRERAIGPELGADRRPAITEHDDREGDEDARSEDEWQWPEADAGQYGEEDDFDGEDAEHDRGASSAARRNANDFGLLGREFRGTLGHQAASSASPRRRHAAIERRSEETTGGGPPPSARGSKCPAAG